jgi:beta-lactamase family protein/aspartyl protease
MFRSMLVPLAILAAAAGPAAGAKPAALEFPETPPGRHARAWFEAFNQGEAAMRIFYEAHVSKQDLARRSVEQRLGVYRQMRQEFARLSPLRVIAGSDDELRIEARPDQGPARLEIGFRTEGPQRTLAGIRVEDIRAGGGEDEDIGGDGPEPRRKGVPPMTDAQVVAALRAHLDSLASAGAFSGAVLLAKGDQVLLRKAWGFASRSDRTPNQADTKFNLGSINKAFTRVAIEQLAAAGKLRLTDTIDRWLTDYPRDKGRRITIQQLLEHRGGTGDIFNDRFRAAEPGRLRTVADWVDLIRDQPLEFEPGTRQHYSNAGYVLLGAIVERASGQSYYDYVREQVYGPAGMRSSDHYARDEAVPNRATGYTRQSAVAGGLRPTLAMMPGRGSPAGGGFSTVDDLLRFAQAMRAGRLGVAGQQGLGIAGGSPGCNAALETMGDYTLVVLANLDPPVAERVASQGRGWLERVGAGAGGGDTEAGGGRRIRLDAGGGARRIQTGEAHGNAADAAGAAATPMRRRIRGGGPDDPHRRPQRTTLPPGGIEAPMRFSGHTPAVEVMVNGQGPFRFALDTGAAGMARIDSALAGRLGLVKVGEVLGGDPSGRNARRMDLMAVDSLAIGPARFIGVTAGASDFRQLPMGTGVDGILGFGLFADGLLTLDYPRERIRFAPGELPPADGAEVLAYREDRGVPRVTMRVADRELEADIDAGFSGGFILPESMAPGLPLASEPRFARRGRTASNEIEIKSATLQGDVTIGRFTFDGPVIEFQPLFPMANVGSKILRDFSLTFDQKNRRIRLVKPDVAARR